MKTEELNKLITHQLKNLLGILLEDSHLLKEDLPSPQLDSLIEARNVYQKELEKFGNLTYILNADFMNLLQKNSEVITSFNSISTESASEQDKELVKQIGKILEETEELIIFFKQLSNDSVKSAVVNVEDFVNNFPSGIYGIKFSLLISPKIKDKKILIPRGNLTTVLDSIVTNAIHAVQGLVNPEILMEVGIKESNLVIRITDNGDGIPFVNQPKIFNRGFTTKSDKGGTGLGLTCAKLVMEVINGNVTLESSCVGRTVFKVSVPLY